MRSEVYFMRQFGANGPVKIGCSVAPAERLYAYNPWSPVELEIVATIEGDHSTEGQFHTLFAHLHSHHEWFHASPEIDAVIQQIKAGTFDVLSLPVGRRLATWGKATWRQHKAAPLQ